MSLKPLDTKSTQKSEEDTTKANSSLDFSYAKIENTPFTIVKNQNGYFIVMGDHRLTDIMETEGEALGMIMDHSWILHHRLMIATYNACKTIETEGNKNETAEQNKPL